LHQFSFGFLGFISRQSRKRSGGFSFSDGFGADFAPKEINQKGKPTNR
jgi:hypothetical protein